MNLLAIYKQAYINKVAVDDVEGFFRSSGSENYKGFNNAEEARRQMQEAQREMMRKRLRWARSRRRAAGQVQTGSWDRFGSPSKPVAPPARPVAPAAKPAAQPVLGYRTLPSKEDQEWNDDDAAVLRMSDAIWKKKGGRSDIKDTEGFRDETPVAAPSKVPSRPVSQSPNGVKDVEGFFR